MAEIPRIAGKVVQPRPVSAARAMAPLQATTVTGAVTMPG